MRQTLPVAFAAVLLSGCADAVKSAGSGQGSGPPKPPVEVQTVAARAVRLGVWATGQVEAYETIAVTARVAGTVERVAFREGDQITAGTTLAEVDVERYRLAREAAVAAVAEAKAAQAEALSGLKRREAANAAGEYVRADEMDAWRAKTAGAQATVDRLAAAAARAELDLRDAKVSAPAAGVVQSRSVATGAWVQPGTTIATLVRRDPLLLRFRVAAADAARLSVGLAARFSVPGIEREREAKIVHLGASADPATRMVEAVATVDAADAGDLVPGSFAQVSLTVASRSAPVVPQMAIRPSENGFLAFIVEDQGQDAGKGEAIARRRVIELGLRTGDGLVEVGKGLAVGDRLIVRGAEQLRDGQAVRVISDAKPATSGR